MTARTHLPALAALGALATVVYANSFHAGFTLDNNFLILADPRVQDATADNVGRILTQDYWAPRFVTGVYRPLTTLSLLLNYALLGGGDDPVGYHVFNLLVHWGNAALVYFLALAVLAEPWAAFLTAALFTVHPVATEAVTNIVGRADLLATLSVLAGTLFYLKSTRVRGRRRLGLLLGLALSTALGLLAKESAAGILGAMLAYDLTYRLGEARGTAGLARRAWELARTGYLALVPAFVGIALVRAGVYGDVHVRDTPFFENPLVGVDFLTARFTAMKVLGRYVWHLVWPANLSFDYSYDAIPVVGWPPRSWEDWQAFVALAAFVAATVLLVRWRRRPRPLVFFALFFLLTFLPTSNLVLLIGTIMGDRLIYLPSVGFAGCLVVGAYALARRVRSPSLARVVLGLLVAAYGARTYARNMDWQDDLHLYESAALAAPGSFKVHKALATALAGQDPQHAQLDRIIDEEERALAIMDRAALPLDGRAWTLLQSLGEHYGFRAGALGTQSPEGRRWLTAAAGMLGQAAAANRAKAEVTRARSRGSGSDAIADAGAPAIYGALGNVQLALGERDQALASYREVTRLAPRSPDAHIGLARIQIARDELQPAAVSLLAALTLANQRQDAWSLLVQVYDRVDPGGCAITRDAGKISVDWTCPRVHTDVCAADAGSFASSSMQDRPMRHDSWPSTPRATNSARARPSRASCRPEYFGRVLPEGHALAPGAHGTAATLGFLNSWSRR